MYGLYMYHINVQYICINKYTMYLFQVDEEFEEQFWTAPAFTYAFPMIRYLLDNIKLVAPEPKVRVCFINSFMYSTKISRIFKFLQIIFGLKIIMR